MADSANRLSFDGTLNLTLEGNTMNVIAAEASSSLSLLAAEASTQNQQIGLVRKNCQEQGIVNISAVADAYHAVKTQQARTEVLVLR